MPETGSAGAQEAGRDCAGRVMSAGLRWPVVDGKDLSGGYESRKAESVSAPVNVATRWISLAAALMESPGV